VLLQQAPLPPTRHKNPSSKPKPTHQNKPSLQNNQNSGKTTIRLQMEDAYARYNADALAAGRSRGFFVVDIARPGHLTACLAAFQEAIGASADNWDAAFQVWQWRGLCVVCLRVLFVVVLCCL
jgi:hypothetical protein